MTEPDFSLLFRQQEMILTELAAMRDDARVSTAILLRVDNTLSRLVDEMRATHAQMSRFNDRLRKLETNEQR